MSSAKKSKSTSTLKALIRKNNHRFLTLWRIIKNGVSSFSRNAWLSVAATAIMIVTLLIISVTLVARNIMVDTVSDIKSKVDMSIYVKQDTSKADIRAITEALESLSNVQENGITYTSPEEAWNDFVAGNSDPDVNEALGEANNMFPGIFHIKLIDINNTSELEDIIVNNETLKNAIDPDREPSFSSSRRAAIDSIASTMNFIEKAGIAAGAVFLIIASLIIFNTIRMAIFNRREEIYMMKLIGADKSYIRGPFVVEAILYGVLAAIITVIVLIAALFFMKDTLLRYGVIIDPTIEFLSSYWILAILGLMVIGILIGIISSMLATRKYLKLLD